MEKNDWRAGLLEKRRAMVGDEGAKEALAAAVADLVRKLEPESVGLYWPLEGEPDVRGALRQVAEETGIALALPVTLKKEKRMIYRVWGRDTPIVRDEAGIACPAESSPEIEPALVLAPCVGFSADGHRIGYGGGYFDRYLDREKERRPVAVGVAFDGLEVPAGVFESFDAPLDYIVTERRVIRNALN